MIPIVVMPAAAILLRLGDIFQFHNPWMMRLAEVSKAGGSAIFENLSLLFAVGIAIGLTSGAAVAGFTATVGYLVFTNVLAIFDKTGPDGTVIEHLDMGVLDGILCGIIAAFLYQKFKDIRLPTELGFFGGRRFVPIITSLVMVVVGVAVGLIWAPVQHFIHAMGAQVISSGGTGAFIYGFLNRLLIPTGLHHILNNLVWVQIGDYTDPTGNIYHGDLTRFFAGDTQAGMFMTGFFPVMMFGIPAAALAIVKASAPQNRKIVMPIMISAGLTSLLTGVTEPVEFAFMFVAPVLYVVHALLTGLSMTIMYLLGVKLGFGFSASLIDLLVNWNLSTRPYVMLLVGVAYFIVYYFVFLALIRLFDFKTPGRETAEENRPIWNSVEPTKDSRAALVLRSIGGADNLLSIDACITRLRLLLKDERLLDEAELKNLGSMGVVRLGKGNVHIVFGTESELIKESVAALLPHAGEAVPET